MPIIKGENMVQNGQLPTQHGDDSVFCNLKGMRQEAI
jgi:hypothetical protein